MIRQIRQACIALALGILLPKNLSAEDGGPYLSRANVILERWVARKDASTSLILDENNCWNIRTTAAGLYPALVLTAWHTNLDLYEGLLRDILKEEQRLTSRLSVFPDDYDLKNGKFVRSSRNVDEILINASAYAGGLARIASVTGHGPWTERLRSIVDAMFLRADVHTDYAEGPLPSADIRVTGRILKTLPLLAELYNDEGYVYYARRLADAYCISVLPKNGGVPAERWNFSSDKPRAASLILGDEGVSFIEGLVSLYEVEVRDQTTRADIYRPTLSAMFDALFQHGIKENGRFYHRLQPDERGSYSIDRKRESPHTARLLTAAHRYGQLSGNNAYVEKAEAAWKWIGLNSGTTALDIPQYYDAATYSTQARQLAEQETATLAELPLHPALKAETDGIYLHALLAAAWSGAKGTRLHPWDHRLSVQTELKSDNADITIRTSESWRGNILLSYERPSTPFVAVGMFDHFHVRGDVEYALRIPELRSKSVWIGSRLAGPIPLDTQGTFQLLISPIQLRPAVESAP